jgi:hypothetical protein
MVPPKFRTSHPAAICNCHGLEGDISGWRMTVISSPTSAGLLTTHISQSFSSEPVDVSVGVLRAGRCLGRRPRSLSGSNQSNNASEGESEKRGTIRHLYATYPSVGRVLVPFHSHMNSIEQTQSPSIIRHTTNHW